MSTDLKFLKQIMSEIMIRRQPTFLDGPLHFPIRCIHTLGLPASSYISAGNEKKKSLYLNYHGNKINLSHFALFEAKDF